MKRVGCLSLLVALSFVGCGDGGASGSTTDQRVIHGEGSLPVSVPGAFPIPAGSEIGSTLVDRDTNRTEFDVVTPSDMAATVRDFQIGLVNQGYVINQSEATGEGWWLRFSRGELAGTITCMPTSTGTRSVVEMNTS